MGFVCGEILMPIPLALLDNVDVVVDSAHASIVCNTREGAKPTNWMPFHRVLLALGRHCGAVFAHAHMPAVAGRRNARSRNNWAVFRGGKPFPKLRDLAIG